MNKEHLYAFSLTLTATMLDVIICKKLPPLDAYAFRPLSWNTRYYINIYHLTVFYLTYPTIISLALWKKKNSFAIYSIVGIYLGWLDIFYFPFQLKFPPFHYHMLPLPLNLAQLSSLAILGLMLGRMIELKMIDKNHSFNRTT